MSALMRLRICSAKCGVEAPISCCTSSTVGSRWTRDGISYSLTSERLRAARLDGHQAGDLVESALRVERDGLRVAEDPDAVVDTRRRIALVAGLNVEQIARH